MFLKAISILKLFLLKLRFRTRLEIKSIRQNFRADTEIFVGKGALLSLGRVSFRTNVHLLCDQGEMHIGNRVVFNRNCIVACRHRIRIGDKCLFGPNICIYDHDHVYFMEGVSPTEFKCTEIVIEEGCWIGANAVILRGAHIGRNSVVEAGAVVKGHIPPNSIVTTLRENRIIPAALFVEKRKSIEKY